MAKSGDASAVRRAPSGSASVSTNPEAALALAATIPGVADPTSATAGPTPADTLRYEETQRTRVFLVISLVIAAVVAGSGWLVNGDPFARWVLMTGMLAIGSTASWLLFKMRTDAGYTLGRSRIAAYGAVYGALTGIYFFGPFSPAPVVLPFGLFFFSLSQSFGSTLSVYVLCAGGELLMGLGAMTGFLRDRGLVRATGLTGTEQLTILFVVEAILLGTFVIGRASRRATLKAVEEHDRVVRSLAQRQALLAEARLELDRVRVGGLGRYTDCVMGSFRLGKLLGRGAMGEVYDATAIDSGAPAAVKLLQPELLRSADSVRRFLREARIAASLESENVVKVLEIGGVEAETPFIAMERLDGSDLSDELRQHARLSSTDALRMARDVAHGLEAARAAGIVHRDLKPANLFHATRADGTRVWKILDFGVSKLSGSMQITLTLEHALVGTPIYMAPEQVLGRPVTHQTDVYALGVICYRVLSGRPAFVGETLTQTAYAVLHHMPPRPSDVQPSLPPAVDAVLAIAMAKLAEQRFGGADEFAEALRAALDGKLDEALRRRAAQLAEVQPWSTTN